MIGGYSGHSGTDRHYGLPELVLADAAVVRFKHLCGEYDTSTGFALACALAVQPEDGRIPQELIARDGASSVHGRKYILLANHYLHRTGTLMLLERLV